MTLKQITDHIAFPEILDTMVGGQFIISPEGTILYWNKGAADITGFPAEEAVGKHCSFLETNTCANFDCGNNGMNCGLFSKGEIKNIRCTCKDRNGRVRHIIRNASVIRDAQGNALGGLESIFDITDLICAEKEIQQLRKSVQGRIQFGRLVGKSRLMQDIYDLISEVAESAATVLISGESGTGKELIADAIHFNGPRKEKPFVKVNCSALPETLLESELFGHVRGSFTGAVSDKEGRFEYADHGTLFLDEIGDLSAHVQVKLLRVIQEKSFERVGSNRTLKSDVRIIAATNRDLRALVKAGAFREDLFYRLNVIPVRVPPLRDRREDIPLIVKAFIDRFNKETGKKIERIDEDALALFMDYDWPGNVRELENAIEHAFVRTKGEILTVYSLPQNLRMVKFGHAESVSDAEMNSSGIPFVGRPGLTKEIIEKGLAKTRQNRQELAKLLGISRTTLWKKMKSLGLD